MDEIISARARRVIAATQKIAFENVRDDSTFKQLAIDSLDGLNILFALEEEFGIDVPDDMGRQFASVSELVAGVELLLARKDP